MFGGYRSNYLLLTLEQYIDSRLSIFNGCNILVQFITRLTSVLRQISQNKIAVPECGVKQPSRL